LNAGSQDALQFVVQAMDDITDINLDANAGVQTTVCQQSFMGLTEDRVIYEACCGERIHKVLDRVNDQCDLLILQVNGEKCPFRDFLNEVAFACMDIGDRANKVRGAGSYKSAKKYIGEMKEAISVYAIAS
jgi:hypothetical protein